MQKVSRRSVWTSIEEWQGNSIVCLQPAKKRMDGFHGHEKKGRANIGKYGFRKPINDDRMKN